LHLLALETEPASEFCLREPVFAAQCDELTADVSGTGHAAEYATQALH
jgi:hypothetical protein